MTKTLEKKSVPKSNLPPEASEEKFFGGKGIFDAVNGGGGKTEKKGGSKTDPPNQYKWQPSPQLHVETPSTTATTYATAPVLNFQATSTKDLKTLREDINKTGIGMDVKTGLFANLSLQVDIPIPEVPGLSIFVGLDGKYARYPNDIKKLSVQENLGVKYNFLDIFSVEAKQFLYLNLEGNDLGAAYIDALKQTAFYLLESSGINKEFNELAKWKDQSFGEKALDLALDYKYGPFSSLVQITKIWSSTVSVKEIEEAYQIYLNFFINDKTAGFELGLGGEASAGFDVGGLEGKVSAQAIVGLEDKIGNTKKATGFTEVAVAAEGKHKGSKLSFRLSKRWRENGSSQITFEFDGEFAGNLGPKTEVVEGLRKFLKAGAFTTAFTAVGGSDIEGKNGSVDISALKEAVVVSLPVKTGQKKIGLSLRFTYETSNGKSVWEVEALIKEMTEFKEDLGAGGIGGEMELQYGSFIEISAEIQKILNEIYPPKTNKISPAPPLPHKNPPIKK